MKHARTQTAQEPLLSFAACASPPMASYKPHVMARVVERARLFGGVSVWRGMLRGVLGCTALALCRGCGRPAATGATSGDALSLLVDRYLDGFARRHPSIAAGNGLHGHDDALEDFSAAAVQQEVEWLRSMRA